MPYDNERKDTEEDGKEAILSWLTFTPEEVRAVTDAQREGDEMKRSFPNDYVLSGPYPPLPKGQTIP